MQTDMKNEEFLPHYFGLTYIVLLLNASRLLAQVQYTGIITYVFSFAVYASYCFVYLLPLLIVLGLLQRVVTSSLFAGAFQRVHLSPMWLIYILTIPLLTFVQLLIFIDISVFHIFGFHLNSFVWNVIFTPGGIQSLGADTRTVICFVVIVAGFFLVQVVLLVLWLRVKRFERFCHALFTKTRVRAATVLLLLFLVFQAITYGFSSFYGYTPVLSASGVFPLYQPFTFAKLATRFGLTAKRQTAFKMTAHSFNVSYPLHAIERASDHGRYNIVWLVAESLRADMLDPNIMPKSYAFSEKALRFEQHYSEGNGTRMAMFGMFYGLYGNYWFNFLHDNRGPVLIDLLLEDDYQMNMFTSARFSYPEFDKTIFARLPQKCLHDETENSPGPGWQRDRENVGRLIDFIENRAPERPFMTFMFFESPHARYYFPPENAIAKPYLEELNYATANIERDIGLIFNRYINSCNHLDSQIWRIIHYLEQSDLLRSTIVLITGDHGEEFMEKGRWGHNSAFSEEQTRTPLIIWIPGVEPRKIRRMTSHLDIPATILSALGVTSPPEDYSLGFDLTGDTVRDFTVLSGWDTLAYVDEEYKAVFPIRFYKIARQRVTTKDDAPVSDASVFYQSRKDRLVQIMREMTRFRLSK
jgi:membrane-anchored protein YejM (alkaline phosphatase superfamily)